ncbi:unnamed protein product [Bursaphelenchus xylophilus]|uniref:(pine wood nematode) hypothetical protein n=1 Tax=Bursaphelenchus xylophilus TaxID=6326 RepID=A0A1I7RP95_BURXY|nr:unnamed protein product [Bursaphelenchus xylophilus]CAG9095633.1 unnamed protein product [Bursaphelenchus xylophilus]
MRTNCQASCGFCQAQQGQYAYPQQYEGYFNSPQYGSGGQAGCSNYYCGGGYSGYCYDCYGGGFVGMVGYPNYYNQNGGLLGGLLGGLQNLILGIGQALQSVLLNLGNLLNSRNYASYGYGIGGNAYCMDYLPGCYMYLSMCLSPYSYYSQCLQRYCPLTCGLCTGGQNGIIGGGGIVPGLGIPGAGGLGGVPNGGGLGGLGGQGGLGGLGGLGGIIG